LCALKKKIHSECVVRFEKKTHSECVGGALKKDP
jgi:hypothetical protein